MLKTTTRMLIAIVVGSLLLIPSLRAGNPRTGEVKDNKYTDLRFGFSVQIPDDWRIAKPKKEYTPQRLIAEQKNPRVPVKLRRDPRWAVKPTLVVIADSTGLTDQNFYNFLHCDTCKSEFKDEVLLRSILLSPSSSHRFDLIEDKAAEVAGAPAKRLTGRIQYDAQVEVPGRDQIELVRGRRTGYIYLIPREGWLMYIEMVCENDFFPSLDETFSEIIDSIDFGGEKSDTLKTEEPGG